MFFCSLSLNIFNIGLQCNLRFLSTTVLQGSVATWVNYGKMFNDLFIANLLLSVTVKKFWRSVRIRQSYGKKSSGTFFFRTRCSSLSGVTLPLNHHIWPFTTNGAFSPHDEALYPVRPRSGCRGWSAPSLIICSITRWCHLRFVPVNLPAPFEDILIPLLLQHSLILLYLLWL